MTRIEGTGSVPNHYFRNAREVGPPAACIAMPRSLAPSVTDLPALQYLPRWRKRGISAVDVDNAEYWVLNATKWDVAGAFRARIVNGELWVRMLSMQPHWAERTSVLRLLLMALRRNAARASTVEGVDIVYAHNDRDPAPWKGWPPGSGSYIPLLTNAHDAGRSSLPLPEFSWVGWHTHTRPWCHLGPDVAQAGSQLPWSNRTDLALFSGGLDNGPMRNQLRKLAATEESRGVIKVRNVAPRFFTTTAAAKAGRDPPQPMSAMCGYKYLISVAGYGYSNRLKSLLMCGSVVIHVRQPWNEFFMPLLTDGKHIAVARSVADIIPTVQRLRANASLARRIGRAGRALALKEMSMGRTLDYLHALLRGYSSIQRERATSTRGFTRVATAAQLGRLAAQCDCGGGNTKPSPTLCGVTHDEFFRGPLRGKHRCCDGWDCPLEICPEAQTAPADGLAAASNGASAAAPARASSAADGDGDGETQRERQRSKARKSAKGAGGVFVATQEYEEMQRRIEHLEAQNARLREAARAKPKAAAGR